MNRSSFIYSRNKLRNGAVLPLVAVLLPVLLLLSGFVINLAYLQLTATELQITSDAAAKAASGTYNRTLDRTLALASANQSGQLNTVAGSVQKFKSEDMLIGSSSYNATTGLYSFTADGGNNAVKIIGRRDATSLNGKVQTFFPNLMGVEGIALNAESVSTRIDVDLVLVIDRSGSMAYNETELAQYPPVPEFAPEDWFFGDPIPPQSRWESAYGGVSEFLDELKMSALSEQVALVTYSTGGSIDQSLTDEYQLILNDLDLRFNNFEGGGTNISSGLHNAASVFTGPESRDFAAKVIVLMTDGKITSGGDPSDFVEAQAELGVMTVTISFSDEADTAMMQKLAEKGKGFHLHAATKDDLKSAFRDIVRRLPTILTQ